MNLAELRVTAIAWTHLDIESVVDATGGDWRPDGDTGEDLAVFAGRACYQSWKRPNPKTASTDGYLRHILEVGHMSVLEHASATFYMTGVSRSFTHELVRHRHFSYSQLSQRYVPALGAALVEPDVIADDKHLHRVFTEIAEATDKAYQELLHSLQRKFQNIADPTSRRKLARQAARAILPNATETKIVVTGNYTGWRHLINMRATAAADVEIREVTIAVLRELQRIAPAVFGDYVISRLDDGTEVAVSELVPAL